MESTAERDHRVMTILSRVLQQPAAERQTSLRAACENDTELYQEIVAAMQLEEEMGSFLLHPAITFREFEQPFEIGQIVLNRFRIVREIGQGGMGVVYEAFDQKRQTRIALKSPKPGFQRHLSPELEGALKVRHANICMVNDILTAHTDHGEIDFLTMELLEGKTLWAHLASHGKLAPPEALEITRQLCAGVAEAHRSGIIHRDLKSANVILCRARNNKNNEDKTLRAVITDFGLAAAMTTQGREIAGTPGYMAPELLRGEKASKASDIYALGVILYEMVTGHSPWKANAQEKSVSTRPLAPSARIKGLNLRWDRAILKCLDPSPAARPSDAAEIIDALEKNLLRKENLLASALVGSVLLAAASQVPQIHDWLVEHIWPSPPNIRLAILPLAGLAEDKRLVGDGVLNDVSDRIAHLRSGNRTVVVIPPTETLSNHVQTPEQAAQILHATHALETSVRSEGEEFVAQSTVVDLSTHAQVRDFTGRYSPTRLGTMPRALAGEVSLALRLQGAAVPEVISAEATSSYDRGLYFLRRDDLSFDAAISMFEEAARLDPRSPLPLAGLVEAEIGKFSATKKKSYLEDAQQYLQAAESLNPDSVSVRLAAGLLNQTTGMHEKALEDYQRVQELEPSNIDALLRLASVYDNLDMSDKAVAAYRKAIGLDPGYYESYEELGAFYYNRGKYPEAVEQFQKSIASAPGMFLAYSDLGVATMHLGHYAEAERALLSSLKLQETARALNNLGAIRVYQGKDADAATYYERAVALDPKDYLYLLNLGDCNRRLGRHIASLASYRTAMALAKAELQENPRSGLTRAYFAYFAARLGDRLRAGDEIRQAMELSPGDNMVVRKAVLTYEALGQRDNAIQSLRGATADVLQELDRHPDLADLRQDPSFQQLVTKSMNGGK